MPTYDLSCEDCGATFERFRQGFLRDEDRVCPECGSLKVIQLMTGFIAGVSSSRGRGAEPTVRNFDRGPAMGGGCCGGACGGH